MIKMEDELSINSVTNEKVHINSSNSNSSSSNNNNSSNDTDNNDNKAQSDTKLSMDKISEQKALDNDHVVDIVDEKPHFRIDWSDLVYYQNPGFFDRQKNKFKKSPLQQTTNNAQQQQQIIIDDPTRPRRILDSLDGCFKSGELSAILGPSGAGKTTFLSALFGDKQDNAYGVTKVTWRHQNEKIRKLHSERPLRIAVIPQQDHLLHHLTVYETLMFASKIKNATRCIGRRDFHRQNVKRVVKMLKLSECINTRCGQLSGGQYKRVSIGQELLSEPDVIILDEPTSGLDAMTCLSTVKTLKSIVTKRPMIIILTIHQPDIDVFNLFDQVYVIAQGGMAIYDGPPDQLVPTMNSVGLKMPSPSYNPARLIVESAFIRDLERRDSINDLRTTSKTASNGVLNTIYSDKCDNLKATECSSGDSSSSDDDDDDDDDTNSSVMEEERKGQKSYIRQSLLSITDAISGKEMRPVSMGKKRDQKPLLNIGIQTLDGKLITNAQLNEEYERQKQIERMALLRRLNEIQKLQYRYDHERQSILYGDGFNGSSSSDRPGSMLSHVGSNRSGYSSSGNWTTTSCSEGKKVTADDKNADSSISSLCNSSSTNNNNNCNNNNINSNNIKSTSLLQVSDQLSTSNQSNGIRSKDGFESSGNSNNNDNKDRQQQLNRSLQDLNVNTATRVDSDRESALSSPGIDPSVTGTNKSFVVNFDDASGKSGAVVAMRHRGGQQQDSMTMVSMATTATITTTNNNNNKKLKMQRRFDKRLSAKHNCSKQTDQPIWYHAFLLTHRTWLSIVRDPIFFGIQAAMHTIIPLLMAAIFGAVQEEGCPRVGQFDLVEFAYADTDNMILDAVGAIRLSIGNVGVMFFEMFVLCFAINCITALVFPMDMHVLLKEYRNGWYSLGSYFLGRTLADLPIPLFLHSVAISMLYYLTGQPNILWRYAATVALTIMASLIAQSTGLTIGALFMTSSQCAVLTAAASTAPIFALSGFIVRIHTLPVVAQIGASISYLYHILNGFIIVRYGFERCSCSEQDFEINNGHKIPDNLHTLASMWIGTYSDEYSDSPVVAKLNTTRSNVDPNIDVVDKMMSAFKMANSYGHKINNCTDVLPYAMLDFNLRDNDVYMCFIALIISIVISRIITFVTIYYKIRSYA